MEGDCVRDEVDAGGGGGTGESGGRNVCSSAVAVAARQRR
jgi:hypothetical protein